MEEAKRVFGLLVTHGHGPSIASYNMLINGYCKAKKMNDAFHLLQKMKVNGLTPDTITYNSLIGGFCKLREVSAAKELFQDMQVNGNNRNLFTYNILIIGLCDNRLLDDAMDLFSLMESNGLKANIVIYDMVQGFLAQKNDMHNTMAMELINTMPREFSLHTENLSMIVDLVGIDGLDSKLLKMLSN